jgi:non-ribosomal peptide synthase protein (TIGR01720 family)
LLALEGHGREEVVADVDLSRTVGWFTSLFPVSLELGREVEPGTVLKAVKEQLRAVPERGIGYGMLCYLRGEGGISSLLAEIPHPEVSFNYLGEFDHTLSAGSLFAPADEESGPAQSQRETRAHVFAITVLVHGGRLRVDWGYSENLHLRSSIERLASTYLLRLRELIAYCRSAEGGYTPSDFPQAALREQDLDGLLAELEETF